MSNQNLPNLELKKLRHSTEHVLHQAIKDLYPDILLAMGPATDDGFYFDFDSTPDGKDPIKISETDFPKIEKRMHQIINQDLPFVRQEILSDEAKQIFADNPYKLEWIESANNRGEKISIYWTGTPQEKGSMVDLCRGPHLESTGKIKAFKLLSVAGAYWHGDEKNKMLTRIYGTSFPTPEELNDYLNRLQEAKNSDHRQLGKDLDLFTFSDLVGKGLPLFTQKGAAIWRELDRFVVDEEIDRGYQHVHTPNIAKTDLYRQSGHYPYYKNTMYPPMVIDEEELILRPMTCPHHFALYQSRPRSYKELPLRFAEMASLYRYEKSGELTGLIRVREFCLADSHNFVRRQEADREINLVLDLIEHISSVLGLVKGDNFLYRLSLGDPDNKEKYYDSTQDWQYAEKLLRQVLVNRQAPFYEAKDEAAFYGPKIDVQMKNVLGKEDTAFTVQYDFCLPKRFNLEYINEKGEMEQPVVIHRSSIGAMERSIGFLIEHYKGAFPVWLSPIQVSIIPISQDQLVYAKLVYEKLKELRVRAELMDQAESMQKRIRSSEKQKIPYMLIIGDQEVKGESVSVRSRGNKDLGVQSLTDFIQHLTTIISTKSTTV